MVDAGAAPLPRGRYLCAVAPRAILAGCCKEISFPPGPGRPGDLAFHGAVRGRIAGRFEHGKLPGGVWRGRYSVASGRPLMFRFVVVAPSNVLARITSFRSKPTVSFSASLTAASPLVT